MESTAQNLASNQLHDQQLNENDLKDDILSILRKACNELVPNGNMRLTVADRRIKSTTETNDDYDTANDLEDGASDQFFLFTPVKQIVTQC